MKTTSLLFGAIGLAVCCAPRCALANPLGGSVVGGDANATITGQGTPLTLIYQHANRAIINWQDFSIGLGEVTRFLQPSANAAALNRVLSGNPSEIYGSLQANGRVFVINPNGILVGASGQIDTKGFYASTLDVPNASFLAGDSFILSGSSRAAIRNEGAIRALGGDVFLIAHQVENAGTIAAPQGTVGLAAGAQVRLAQAGAERLSVLVGGSGGTVDQGVNNLGSIEAAQAELKAAGGNIYALAINNAGVVRANAIVNEGGKLYLRATGGNIQNSGSLAANNADGSGGTIIVDGGHNADTPATVTHSGTIAARGETPGAKGGTVQILGDYVGLFGEARVDVSGAAGGGRALIGGDFQGRNPTVPNALRTFVGPDAQVRADALGRGDGGTVVVWSDEATRFYGTISARGGAVGGDGGFVEVSSGLSLAAPGAVSLAAPHGAAGTLLYDPLNILIQGGNGDGDDQGNNSPTALRNNPGSDTLGSILFSDEGATSPDPFVIRESEIEGSDANIILEARNRIAVSGTFDNDADGGGAADPGLNVVLLKDGRNLTLRTRNNAGDGIGGIDLTAGGTLNNLEFKTQGGGSITLQTGNDGLGGGGTEVGSAPITVGKLTTTGGSTVGSLTTGGAITIQAEGTLTVNGALTTGTIAGANDRSVTTGAITLASQDGDVQINAPVTTGQATVDDAGGDHAGTSGSIAITAGSSIAVAAAGALTTGDVNWSGANSGSDSATSGSIVLTAGSAGAIAVGADLTTGNATIVDGQGAGADDDTALSGSITLSAGTSVSGAGRLVTGNASVTGADQAGPDAATSGSLSVTAGAGAGSGGIGLSAADALTVGTAQRTGGGAVDAATAGHITLNALDEINNGTASSPLRLRVGAASGSAANTQGSVAATTSGAGGNVWLASSGDLRLGAFTTAGGLINIAADTLEIAGALNSGSARTTLRPFTAGRAIRLGDNTGASLNLTDAELDNVTAGVLQIGDAGAGDITFGGAVSPANASTLSLQTGGAVISQAAAGADVTVNNLALRAGTGVGSAGAPLETAVTTLAADNTTSGDVEILNTGALTLGTVDGLAGVSSPGNVNVLAGSPLTVASAVSAVGDITLQAGDSGAAGDKLTLSADVQSTGGGTITLIAGDDIEQTTGAIQSLGGADNLVKFTADNEGDGSGAITQNGGSLAADMLVFRSAGDVAYTAGNNNVDRLAANVTGAGSKFSYTDADALEIGSVDGVNGITTTGAGADVSLTAGGHLTSSQKLAVGGASTFTVTAANADVLLDQANILNAVTVAAAGGGSVRNVTLRKAAGSSADAPTLPATLNGNLTLTWETTGITLPGVTVLGDLNVKTVGPIDQSGVLVVDQPGKTASFDAGSGNDIALDTQNNDFRAVTVTSGKDVKIKDTDDLAVGGTVSGNLTTTAAATAFDTLTVGGVLQATAQGDITQTGPITATAGASTFTLDGVTGDVLLGNPDNDFGAQTITVQEINAADVRNVALANKAATAAFSLLALPTGLNDLTIHFANAPVSLPALTLTGNLDVTAGGTDAAGWSINQSGALLVNQPGKSATFNVVAGSDVLLAGFANDFTALAISSGGALRDLKLRNVNAGATLAGLPLAGLRDLTLTFDNAPILLPALTLTGDLNVTAGGMDAAGWSINQSGALLVNQPGKVANFTAPAASDVLLGLANDFTSVNVAVAGGGNLRDLTLRNVNAGATLAGLPLGGLRNLVLAFDNAPLTLPALTLTGNLEVSAGGLIDQSGALLVNQPGATATFNATSAHDVKLDNAGNDFTTVAVSAADNVTLRDQNAVVLGPATVSGTFQVTAQGNISQSGALTVPNGASTFTIDGVAASVLLDTQPNDFAGQPVQVGAVNLGSVVNVGLRNVSPAALYPTLPLGLQNLTLVFDAAPIALPGQTVSGLLDLTAGGDITQTGPVFANVLRIASAGAVTLLGNNDVDSLTATLTTAGKAFQFADVDDLVIVAPGIQTVQGQILLKADSLEIVGPVNSGSARTKITPFNTRDVDLGTETAGRLSLKASELAAITAGVLEIDPAADIYVTAPISLNPANVPTLALVNNGAISGGGSLTVQNLRLSSLGPVTLSGDVDTLAAQLTGPGAALSFVDGDDLTVGSVDGVSGLTTANGVVALTAGAGLTLNQAVNAGAASVWLDTSAGGAVGGAGLLSAGALGVLANAGIGSLATPLNTAVANLEAQTVSGGIFLNNLGNLAIGNVSLLLQGVRVTGSGNILLNNAGSLSILNTAEIVQGPGNITLQANGAAADLATGGNNATINGAVASSGGTVTLTAGRDLLFGTAGGFGDVRGDSLALTAGRDVVIGNGTFVDAVGAGGGVTLNAGQDLNLASGRITTVGGPIDLTAGVVTLNGLVDAQAGPVAINHSGLLSGSGKVTGGTLALTGAGDVNPLNTAVGTLTLAKAGRTVNLTEDDALTVSGAAGTLTLTAGDTTVGAAGLTAATAATLHTAALTLAGNVSSPAVTLDHSGALTWLSGTVNADTLTLQGAGAVGTAANRLHTAVSTLLVDKTAANAGNAFVQETDALNLHGTTTGNLDVQAGDTTVDAALNVVGLALDVGALNVNNPITASGDVTATAGDTILNAVLTAANATLQTAHLALNDQVNVPGTVRVAASGDVTEGAGGRVNAGALGVRSAGDVVLTGNNDVDTLAARLSTAGKKLEFRDGDDVTVGTVAASGGFAETVGVQTENGPVTLTADTLEVAAALHGGSARVWLQPLTPAREVSLGAEVGGRLSLTGAELGRITAGTLQIGNATVGAIEIGGPAALPNVATLALINNAPITASGAGALQVASLRLSTPGPVALTGDNDVNTLAVALSGAGNAFSFSDTDDLTVGTADGVIGVATVNGPVTLTANALEINEAVVAGTARAVLQPFSAGTAINLGGEAGGLSLTDAELDRITAGTLQIGHATAGALQVVGAVSPANVTTLALVNNGAVTEGAAGALQVANLRLSSAGPVTLNGANDVDTVAAAVTGGGETFSLADQDGFTVGTVDGVIGITTASGDVTLKADALDLAAAVTAGLPPGTVPPPRPLPPRVTLLTYTAGRPIELAALDNPASLSLSDVELDRITAGTLQIGDLTAGNLTINTEVSPVGVPVLSLRSGGTISELAGGRIVVPRMCVDTLPDGTTRKVQLLGPNDWDHLAATGSGIEVNDIDDLSTAEPVDNCETKTALGYVPANSKLFLYNGRVTVESLSAQLAALSAVEIPVPKPEVSTFESAGVSGEEAAKILPSGSIGTLYLQVPFVSTKARRFKIEEASKWVSGRLAVYGSTAGPQGGR